MKYYEKEITNRLSYINRRIPSYIPILFFLFTLLIWESICSLQIVNSLYLPSPSSILLALKDMIINGELWNSLLASLQRIILGFILGASLGIMLGLLFAFSKLLGAIGTPFIYALYPIPKIALLPLIILWLGIGELSKVTIIALGVFFPVMINTYSGVKQINPLYLKVAASFRTSRYHILKKILWPAALPTIFTGLKIAASSSLLLLVAAEMIAAKEGLGALILHYGDLLLTTKLMAGIVVLSLLGIIFNWFFTVLEKKYTP